MLTKREIEIIKLRKKGLKQKEIAKKLGLSQPAISKFENNVKRKIKDSLDTIKIVKKLGVRIEP
jgi:Tfx family DNA-binding protein